MDKSGKFMLNQGVDKVDMFEDDNDCGVDFDEIIGNYVASSVTLKKLQQSKTLPTATIGSNSTLD